MMITKIDKIRAAYARARSFDTELRNIAERRVDPCMAKVAGAGDGRQLRMVKAERGSLAARREKKIEAELTSMEKSEIAKVLSSCTIGAEVLADRADSDDSEGTVVAQFADVGAGAAGAEKTYSGRNR